MGFSLRVKLINRAEVSKQNMEDVVWLLAACSKRQEEVEKWRKELVSRKEPAHNLENSQPVHIAKGAKVSLGLWGDHRGAETPAGEIRFVTVDTINHFSRSQE